MSDEIDLGVLADSFSELLREECPREKALAFAKAGGIMADDLWVMMAGLGWPALTVPEEFGGLGLGLDAAAHLHAALGAAVVPSPMLGTTLASTLLSAAGTDAQKAAWLPGIADGSVRVAMSQPGDAPLNADGASVSGIAADVLDAPAATLLILNATYGGAACWILVPVDASGVSITPQKLSDSTHMLGTVTLANVALDDASVIRAADAAATSDLVLRAAAIALSADALGGGDAVLALTIDYMKVREQFNRLIGSFQALKHRVADHNAALVGSRALLNHAA